MLLLCDFSYIRKLNATNQVFIYEFKKAHYLKENQNYLVQHDYLSSMKHISSNNLKKCMALPYTGIKLNIQRASVHF